MAEHTIHLAEGMRIPDFLIGDVQSRLAYVDETIASASVSPDGLRILLQLRDDPGPQAVDRVEARVARVLQAMVPGAIRPRQVVLEDHLDRGVPNASDPLPDLIKRREVVQEAPGVVVLGPLMAGLMDFFEREFLDLARSFGALGYRFPALISPELLGRVEYFRSFPHSLSFVCHMREDLDAIEKFSLEARCEHGLLQMDRQALSAVLALLSPAVCFHYYGALSGTRLPDNVCATAVGSCFRYEAGNMEGLERLWNFTMREIIFVGARDFVLQNRETARERVAELLGSWGLAYRVESASDPFFVGDFKKQVAFQGAFQLKYEVRALIPHRKGTLAVGSYNFHQDFFGRHLDIALPEGPAASTGCVAFGLERLAYAFLAQYGLQPSQWPEKVRLGVSGG